MSKLQSVVDDTDIEQWYWDEVQKIDTHARQLEDMLYSRLEHMRKAPAGGYVNTELGFGPTKRNDIRRAERCLNHATILADYTERISAKSPLNGTSAPYTPLTWTGFGLSVTGLIMLLIGVLIFAGSKRVVFATVAGIALGIFLIAFVILLLVVT
jgi:hypothetical protein